MAEKYAAKQHRQSAQGDRALQHMVAVHCMLIYASGTASRRSMSDDINACAAADGAHDCTAACTAQHACGAAGVAAVLGRRKSPD